MTTLEAIGIVVTVVGGFKAVEYIIGKINAQHDKSQQIESNSSKIEKYETKTDQELELMKHQIAESHKAAADSIKSLQDSITSVLEEHKKEYMSKIADLEASITQMEAAYQQTIAIFDIKIENLEKAQNKHNNLIERMYAVEKKLDVQEEQLKVSNHRLSDLEAEIKGK